MKNIAALFGVFFILSACGGGSKLSLQEAEQVTLHYQGENYTPPPRGVDKLISEIESAGAGLIQEHVCKMCPAMDPQEPNLRIRLDNLSHLAIVSHMRGNSQLAVKYIDEAVRLLDHPEIKELYSERQRSNFDHVYFLVLHRAAIVAMDIGRYSDSVRFMRQAIKHNENKIKPWKGKFLYQYSYLAAAYAELGNVDEAESALETGEQYFSEIKRASKRVERFALMHKQMTLMTNGIIKNSQGNLREAEEYFRNTIDSMAEYTSGRKGWTYTNRAKVKGPYLVSNLLAQGRIAEAEAQAIDAIRYSLNIFGYEGYVTATMLQTYVKVLIARERYSDARKIIKLADNIFNKIGAKPSSIQWVKLKMSLADVFIAEGNLREAKNIYQKLYNDLESEPEVRKGLFYENLNWAVLLAFDGNISEAEKVAVAAIEKDKDVFGSDHINTAEAQGILAMIKASSGQEKAAEELFESILPAYTQRNGNSQSNHSGINTQRTKLIFEAYLDLLAKSYKSGNAKAAERAFYVSQIVQGKHVQNAVSSSAARASIKDPELITLVRKEQDASRKIEAGYNKLVNNNGAEGNIFSDIKSNIQQLEKARDSILNEISNRFPEYDNLVRPQPVSIEKAKTALAGDEALIMTYSGLKNLYVWTVLQDGRIHLNQVKATSDSISETVTKLRKGLDIQVSTLNEIPAFNLQLAHELYNTILRPGAHLWRSSKTMTIIADGAISSLPLSVLVLEPADAVNSSSKLRFSGYRDVPWLASKYATSYAPSISTLVSLRSLKIQHKPQMQFAGFGNPVFGSSAVIAAADKGAITSRGISTLHMRGLRKTRTGSLDNQNILSGDLSMLVALPDTADEVLRVAGALKVTNQGNVFLGADANEQRIKSMPLNNRRVLMFATHALLPGDLDGLVQPAIALSATNNKNSENDGLLTMGEIMGLDLNADWVVLSACNTGAESGKGATAVSGLGQAFFYAGARSLLVSHWPVETTSAKQITTGLFDRQVAEKTLTRAIALNETVKDLIQNKTYKNDRGESVYAYAHPVFWAPFTIIGDGSGTIQ